MKRTALLFIILALLVAMPAMAQNFDSPKAQFLSFSIGTSVGIDFEDDADVKGGTNFGLDFAVIDNLSVGINRIGSGDDTYNFLRVGFSFTDNLGAAFGIGAYSDGTDTESAVSLGAFANLFQNRSAMGLAYGLGLRIEYIAPTDSFDEGRLFFTLGVNFGI